MAEPAKKLTLGECIAVSVTDECQLVVLQQLEVQGNAAVPKTAPGPCICPQLLAAGYKVSVPDPAASTCMCPLHHAAEAALYEMTQTQLSVLARSWTANLCGVTWLPGGCPCAAR